MSKIKSLPFIFQLHKAIKKTGKKAYNLTVAQHCVLIALSIYADNDTGEAYPTIKQLSDSSNLCVRQIYPALRGLESRGFVSTKRSYDKVKKMTRNFYKIHLYAILSASQDENGDLKIDNIEIDKSCTKLEPSAHNAHCSDIEPSADYALDQCARDALGSPYILTTKELTTNTHQKNVQIGDFGHASEMETRRALGSNIEQGELVAFGEHGFEDFWTAYPRKEAKQNAKRAWTSGQLNSKAAAIIEDVRLRLAKHLPWQEGRKFIPLPASYLNGERWTDEMITNESEGKLNHGKQRPQSTRMQQHKEYSDRVFEEYRQRQREGQYEDGQY